MGFPYFSHGGCSIAWRARAEMVKAWLAAALIVWGSAAQSQTLILDSCHTQAQRSYPATRQYELIRKITEREVSNEGRGFLPRITVEGQATYQSDVTQFPNIPVVGVDIPTFSKDQYKLYGTLYQPLGELLVAKGQQTIVQLTGDIEKQKLDVELYQLRDRIDQLFFSILLIDGQLAQHRLLMQDIQIQIDRATAAMQNGAATQNDIDMLQAELIKTSRYEIELKASRKGCANALTLFIGQPIDEQTTLEQPAAPVTALEATIGRPELQLYETQQTLFTMQHQLSNFTKLPSFGLSFRGGIARPGLNFLSNDLSPLYVVGLQLNWNVSKLYTISREKEILALNNERVGRQREAFLLETQMATARQDAEIAKLRELVATDITLVELQKQIKETAKQQLDNGAATVSDYILRAHAEDRARQDLLLHKTQLIMAQYKHKRITGN